MFITIGLSFSFLYFVHPCPAPPMCICSIDTFPACSGGSIIYFAAPQGPRRLTLHRDFLYLKYGYRSGTWEVEGLIVPFQSHRHLSRAVSTSIEPLVHP